MMKSKAVVCSAAVGAVYTNVELKSKIFSIDFDEITYETIIMIPYLKRARVYALSIGYAFVSSTSCSLAIHKIQWKS